MTSRYRTIASWAARLLGYDFFISYKRVESSQYAAALESRLFESDFACFLDENEAPAGSPLTRTVQHGLSRSRVMILLASPGAIASDWVGKEVETFAKKGREIICH
jgi:hypothetical protein